MENGDFTYGMGAFIAQRVRKICEHLAQRFLAAPLLEAPMHRLVVRVALRKHVPLSASIENPQHRLENFARRDRFAAWTIVWNMLLRKVLPDQRPLLVGYA